MASPKRPLDNPHSKFQGKKARTRSMSPQNVIQSCLESREKVLEPPDRREGTDAGGSTSSVSKGNPSTMLYIKDNKTRQHPSVPPHHDTLRGRLQLMLYRRLLSQLVAKSPLYDFKPLWKRLGIKSSSRLPTKFLVQAKLIPDNADFQTISLDDVVTSWHELVKQANVQSVNENLELVYRLRFSPGMKQKSKKKRRKKKAIFFPEVDSCDTANSPKDIPTPKMAASEGSTAGPSNYMEDSATVTDVLGALSTVVDLEEAQLQWALRQSMVSPSDQEGGFPGGK
jgi:exonuclease V